MAPERPHGDFGTKLRAARDRRSGSLVWLLAISVPVAAALLYMGVWGRHDTKRIDQPAAASKATSSGVPKTLTSPRDTPPVPDARSAAAPPPQTANAPPAP